MKFNEFFDDLELCVPFYYGLKEWKKHFGLIFAISLVALFTYCKFNYLLASLPDAAARILQMILPAVLLFTSEFSFASFMYPEIEYLFDKVNSEIKSQVIRYSLISIMCVIAVLVLKVFL